ncbi:MAG: hypothetical protein HC913_08860 [Microscillaceae bacterium]|nr:hypothetical protein [Microscillaceae bacterium]
MEARTTLPLPAWVLPTPDCPGPEEVLLHDQLALIFINTPWWFAQENQAVENSVCEISDEAGFLAALRDALRRHQHRQVLVLGHHPLVSNGKIGGHFPWTQHLWPLPGLGSLGWAYRKTLGLPQDQASLRYRQLQKSLKILFSAHPRLIYACGYEGSLQYHPLGPGHHFQSGSWGKKSFLVGKKGAHFVSNQPGDFQLVFPPKEAAYWQVYIGQQLASQGVLFDVPPPLADSLSPLPDYQGKTITRPLNPAYAEVSRYRRWTLGQNYRREWATPVPFPYFDWGADLGGLKIIKQGGGQATNSLRLEAPDGRQYVLRSVDKQGDKALPDALKNTFVADIVQDQTSAAHPYAPLVVPRLAEAAGLSHARPRYVYLAPDPRLEGYEALADDVYLFEERPDDTFWRDVAHFGSARDIKSTAKVLEKIQSDNDERIDQRAVVKYRLFDIWLGDWDRHDDQWRWGQYEDKNTKQKIYRPIPRDRDQVFFNSDGKLVDLASHEWGLPKFQGFKARIRSIRGYNFNARYFDRFFLTEPIGEDWQAAARELQAALSDSVIALALADLPAEVQFRNAEIAAKLRQRREDLPIYAEAYFQFLSKAVSIIGSDKHELFEITHQGPPRPG